MEEQMDTNLKQSFLTIKTQVLAWVNEVKANNDLSAKDLSDIISVELDVIDKLNDLMLVIERKINK